MSPPLESATPLPQLIKKGTVADRVALFTPQVRDISASKHRPNSRTPSALKALTGDRKEHPDLGTRVAFGRRREESFGTPAARAPAIGDDQHSLSDSTSFRVGAELPLGEASHIAVKTKNVDGSPLKTAQLQYNLSARRIAANDSKSKFQNTFRKFKISEQKIQNEIVRGSPGYTQTLMGQSQDQKRVCRKNVSSPVTQQQSADLYLKSRGIAPKSQQPSRPEDQRQDALQDQWSGIGFGIPKSRKDSRALYEGKLRQLDERIPISPSTSASTSSDESSEIKTILYSDSGSLREESEKSSRAESSEYKSPIGGSTNIQHCRPRSGRKPRFLTDDSIVEALERESPQLFQGPPESPNQIDNVSEWQIRPSNIAGAIKSGSIASVAASNHTKQLKTVSSLNSNRNHQESTSHARPNSNSASNKRPRSRSATSSQDIADQPRHIELSKQISQTPTPRPFESLSFREALDSPGAAQTPWRKQSDTLRSSLSMQRIRGSLSRGKSKNLSSNRKRSIANFFTSINTPIRQWSFSERWGHIKSDKKQAEQMKPQKDGTPLAESRKQSVSDAAKSSKVSITDGSGRSPKRSQEKTCYISFEEPRRFSRRMNKSPNNIPLRSLRRSSKSNDSEPVTNIVSEGRIRGLSVIVTLDGGAEIVVNAKVSGQEWNVKAKDRSSSLTEK